MIVKTKLSNKKTYCHYDVQLKVYTFKIKTNKLGIWTAILFISTVGLFLIIISLLKKQYYKKIDVGLFRCILANISAALITPLLLFFFSIKFADYPAHSYLINHLFLYGILVIIINKIPYRNK